MSVADILNADPSFRYQMLDRMRSDCEYYIGFGNRNVKNLWSENEVEQIANMKALWNSFPEGEKPEGLSYEKILEYEKKMCPVAILVERDYKGEYERFALTPEEFQAEFPETYDTFGPIIESNSDTLRPLVHIWFAPCHVGDDAWQQHFTDMEQGLPQSDIDAGNLAYIRVDFMQSLKPFLPKDALQTEEHSLPDAEHDLHNCVEKIETALSAVSDALQAVDDAQLHGALEVKLHSVLGNRLVTARSIVEELAEYIKEQEGRFEGLSKGELTDKLQQGIVLGVLVETYRAGDNARLVADPQFCNMNIEEIQSKLACYAERRDDAENLATAVLKGQYQLDLPQLDRAISIREKAIRENVWTQDSNIQTWYKSLYPDDKYGMEINPDLSFKELVDRMNRKEDFYDIAGQSIDTLIRERIFTKAAELFHVDYNCFYNKWLYPMTAPAIPTDKKLPLLNKVALATGKGAAIIDGPEQHRPEKSGNQR